jgi:Homeodomain-like domain
MISTPNLYPVRLEPGQRQALEELTRNGRAPAKKMRHAQVLLLSDHNRPGGKHTDVQIADALGMHVNTVAGVRKLFVTQGEQPALQRKPRLTPPVPPKIDGAVEAHIIAICTGPPPEGRARWTMELIAGELVRREVLTSISGEAVRRVLKKTRSSPGRSSRGASRSATTPGSSPTWNGCSTSTPPNTPRTNR